ncbi:UPF0481 protein At3g47200-like [Cucurbita moschata]|uniref:UPF0481 protein At3g47200-like n=1 Tax=Cucurbita moschata TaxID=3662 RepID=A0A6J1EI35_CUCMO|nr:UPF0481 protein At3g47200-like [Cucurbita moschata]
MVETIIQNLESHLANLQSIESKGIGASIYRIPEHIMNVNPNAFKPKLVSFGPYHHGELHLMPMEKKKHEALWYFKKSCRGLTTEKIVSGLWNMLGDLQGSYDKLDDKWKKEPLKFLELMILDGCLIMHIFLEDKYLLKFNNVDVQRDMLLLENQLPMMLLDKLYSILKPGKNKFVMHPLNVKSLVWESDSVGTGAMEKDYLHLLDMYRWELNINVLPRWSKLQVSHLGTSHEIRLATRFHKAGIKLEKGWNLRAVSFDENKGILSLPFIEMNANIESGLLNAMAFEKLSGIDNIVGSFVVLMGNLLKKGEVDSFNQLAKGEVLSFLDYYSVYRLVNEHCKRPWRIWWTTLKDVNFQNPWTIISTLSASIGFVLLILQTVYGMYGYYLPRRS